MNGVQNDRSISWRDLAKVREGRKLFGVCSGLGKYTSVPTWIWRAMFLVAAFCWGFGILVYVVMIICMPSEPANQGPPAGPGPAGPGFSAG